MVSECSLGLSLRTDHQAAFEKCRSSGWYASVIRSSHTSQTSGSDRIRRFAGT